MAVRCQVARTVGDCRAAIGERRAKIGFVPTMGAFHDGHVSLMRRAREECDVVVVSLYVNPTQFNDVRDLSTYPRDEVGDLAIAADAGVDIVFAPTDEEMFPGGPRTTVEVTGMTRVLEGASRGVTHFRGVATIVTKLFNVVQPDVAYFGQKDAQQALLVMQQVRDLLLPVHIEVLPTVRESDGLAMSSRNARLSAHSRRRAASLYAALLEMQRRLSAGERSLRRLVTAGRRALDVDRIDYLEIVEPETFLPLDTLRQSALAVVAACVGRVRLIDNLRLTP